VVLVGAGDQPAGDPGDDPAVDVPASDALRARLRAARPPRQPFVDRGPGFPRLAGGRTSADCDWC